MDETSPDVTIKMDEHISIIDDVMAENNDVPTSSSHASIVESEDVLVDPLPYDGETEEAQAVPLTTNPKKRRGDGLVWTFVRKFVNKDDAMTMYCKQKLLERGLSKGRITRGKTDVFYFNCAMMTCGCRKKWRLRTTLRSCEYLEEETPEPHTNHEKHQRFEGRGISFAQESIVEEALSLNILKPSEIINHFRHVTAAGIKNGKHHFNICDPFYCDNVLKILTMKRNASIFTCKQRDTPISTTLDLLALFHQLYECS